jgi:hypothetical protein
MCVEVVGCLGLLYTLMAQGSGQLITVTADARLAPTAETPSDETLTRPVPS